MRGNYIGIGESMTCEASIVQFCRAMGIGAVALPLEFTLENEGVVHLEAGAMHATISLVRHVPAYMNGVARAALLAVHPDRGLPASLRATFLDSEHLVLLIRIENEEVTADALDAALRLLVGVAAEVTAAAS